jgi:hypothetical protein
MAMARNDAGRGMEIERDAGCGIGGHEENERFDTNWKRVAKYNCELCLHNIFLFFIRCHI